MDKVKSILTDAGHPLHITDIMKSPLFEGASKNKHASVIASINYYVRNGNYFTRTAKSTYGLI